MAKIYRAESLFYSRWHLKGDFLKLFFKMTHGIYSHDRLRAMHDYCAAMAADELHRVQQAKHRKSAIVTFLLGA